MPGCVEPGLTQTWPENMGGGIRGRRPKGHERPQQSGDGVGGQVADPSWLTRVVHGLSTVSAVGRASREGLWPSFTYTYRAWPPNREPWEKMTPLASGVSISGPDVSC